MWLTNLFLYALSRLSALPRSPPPRSFPRARGGQRGGHSRSPGDTTMSRTNGEGWSSNNWPSAPATAPGTLGQRRRGASPSYNDQNNAYNPYAASSTSNAPKTGFSLPEANPLGQTSLYPAAGETRTSFDTYAQPKDSYGVSLLQGGSTDQSGWYGNQATYPASPPAPQQPAYAPQSNSFVPQPQFSTSQQAPAFSMPDASQTNGFFQAAGPMFMAGMASALGETTPSNAAAQMGFQYAANQFQAATTGMNQNVRLFRVDKLIRFRFQGGFRRCKDTLTLPIHTF